MNKSFQVLNTVVSEYNVQKSFEEKPRHGH